MHRMGLNPFLTFYMLNFDGDIDANANVMCEHTITMSSLEKCAPSSGVLVITEQFNNVVNETLVLVNYLIEVAEMHVFCN